MSTLNNLSSELITKDFNFSDITSNEIVNEATMIDNDTYSSEIYTVYRATFKTEYTNWTQLMGDPTPSNPIGHFGQVKFFRREFKEYSKEDFRKMSKTPIIKEILAGMVHIPKEDVAERIKLHLEQI